MHQTTNDDEIGTFSRSSASSSSSSSSSTKNITKTESLLKGMVDEQTNHITTQQSTIDEWDSCTTGTGSTTGQISAPPSSTTPSSTPSQQNHYCMAIVFGTALGHVYTIELSIQPNDITSTSTSSDAQNPVNHHHYYYYSLRHLSCPLLLSMGQSMVPLLIHPSHRSSNHSTTSSSSSSLKPPGEENTVGIQSLYTTVVPNNTTSVTTTIAHHQQQQQQSNTTYFWVTYHTTTTTDPLVVRVHAQCCFPIRLGYSTTMRQLYPKKQTTNLIVSVEQYIQQQQFQRQQPPPYETNDSTKTTFNTTSTTKLSTNMILHCNVDLPHHRFQSHCNAVVVVPLPRFIPSSIAPLQDICNHQYLLSSNIQQHRGNVGDVDDDTIVKDDPTVVVPNSMYHQYPKTLLDQTEHDEPIQVLVYFPNQHHIHNTTSTTTTNNNNNEYTDLNPTFAFYTSVTVNNNHEQQQHRFAVGGNTTEPNYSNTNDNVDDSVVVDNDDDDDGILLVSVTKAIVGTAFGAIRWGFTGGSGGGKGNNDNHTNNHSSPKRRNHSVPDRNGNRDRVHDQYDMEQRRPITLQMSNTFHDVPRTIEFCTVDPGGRMIATADVLGRILLIDATTQQIIRMWKGFRDATCHWIQQVQNTSTTNDGRNVAANRQRKNKIQLYLLIHSRQRRIIEIWPVRYGDRVSIMSVSRDAKVIPFTITHSTSCDNRQVKLAQCYLIQSTMPGSNPNTLELIRIDNNVTGKATRNENILNSPLQNQSKSTRTDTKLSGDSVRNGAVRLKHLQQLLSANEIQYSLDDVRNGLHDISSLVDLATAIDLIATSPGLEEKLMIDGSSFHWEAVSYCRDVLSATLQPSGPQQLAIDPSILKNPYVQALSQKITYHEQLLKAFDNLYKFGITTLDTNVQQVKSPSHWAAEAMAWASTYEQVTGVSLDKDIAGISQHQLRFTEFASSCKFPEIVQGKKNATFKIYFSDSSRTRRSIIEHVFKPLLGDAFSLTIADSVFDTLGIRSDFEYTQLCFAEWFMTLSIRDACKKGLYADSPPMIHFLRALTLQQLSSGPVKDTDHALGSIVKFCEESTDLVRSFMLGALCLEAVSKATTQIDKVSVTKDTATKLVSDWKSLLRKLRMCLLVSLRLHGNIIAAPITIDNINQPDIFSVFEWLALDELSMSHNHDEIVSLEKACSISSYTFDPSLPDGDGPSRFKMLQSSCLAAAVTEEERAEYLVDFNDDDRFGALLLFLSSHNVPKILAANRALLLATKWGSNPKNLQFIYDAVDALKSLSKTNGFKPLASAVCVEIWQSRLCPIYRAHMFGFSDVQELSEDIVSPLIQETEWLTAVCRIGLQLLAVLQDCKVESLSEFGFDPGDEGRSWPLFRSDFKLQKLVEKLPRQVDESALNIHSVVLCAFLVSSDIEALAQCISTLHDLYLPYSLFQPMINSTNVPELQQKYLNNAIITFAGQYTAPELESFDLGEIMTLAKVWSFNLGSVRTLFLLAMYELGKDLLVDELVAKSSFLIDGTYFVEGGVSIACVRLNILLTGGRMHSASLRNAIGVLDAELCEWIKQRASKTVSVVEHPAIDIAIRDTHQFVMRLLSIGVSCNVEKDLRVRIHSLLVLSGILMKAI